MLPSAALGQVRAVNSSVQSEVAALLTTFESTKSTFDGYCSDIDSFWASSGLPRGNGNAGAAAYEPEPLSPLDLETPAREVALTVGVAMVLPALLLLGAWLCCCRGSASGRAKGASIYCNGCGCGLGSVVLVALMLLLLGSVIANDCS